MIKNQTKEIFMLKYFAIVLGLSMGLLFAGSDTAEAASKQCIYNDSATILKVTWYNPSGGKDKGASNDSLSYGFKACQDNKNLGWAVIECQGCGWAEASAKAAVILGGAGAYGVCVYQTKGECTGNLEGFAEATAYAVSQIPDSFKGKMVVVPDKGKTQNITGNAFGLKVKK
jgi:hypothetical protein